MLYVIVAIPVVVPVVVVAVARQLLVAAIHIHVQVQVALTKIEPLRFPVMVAVVTKPTMHTLLLIILKR